MSNDDFKDLEELDEELAADSGEEESQEPVTASQQSPGLSWAPAGACFRAESIDTEKIYTVNGQMVPESQLKDTLRAIQEDPELYNFLLMKQKETFEPDQKGLRICGGDPRDPDIEELENVIGRICPFCGERISEDEATVSDMGSLVFYGPDVWHWEHLALMALLACRGHYRQAAEKYHLPLEDLKCMRTIEMRSLNWGRLGWRRDGQ